ncbi:MAG TPA: hypothetical protein VMR98_03190 [Candidatus Polarisedimenticolaceae bacterium]|nr:hypothetical protein [Candidatus Polarisedimenticolaceae bacterium]
MFKQPFNFALKRTTKEAVGFYIIQLILVVAASAAAGAIYATATGSQSFNEGVKLGTIVAGCWSLAVGILAASKRKKKNAGTVILAVLSGFLGVLGGGLLGLLLPAYLTTRE